jgi:hypothetical protein
MHIKDNRLKNAKPIGVLLKETSEERRLQSY